MYNVKIRRPNSDDLDELNLFFRLVITHTFKNEGLSQLLDDIENEINTKKQYLKTDFDSNGEKRYFLLAIDTSYDKIIGTIEIGPASTLINSCTGGALKDLYEIGTVFILPEYQRKGIGSLLLNTMFLTLLSRGITEYCLDSGYKKAQSIWTRKFGEPSYVLKDYWGESSDHMIWKKSLHDTPLIFEL
ncbi:GNAT family N-acetyltransferase [Bacillus wiedmannii]|uniref:GNAT family N-acetyltransferase n=1 Tax=Bacillus wiedmannii TaxID=1890302 RepID=UPI000BEF688D|nr:GNAT family N-acetyltransferase [Bacillus wiedmannii]PEI74026.1 GNAT family N-acetyltransferase [Bacillus wiedmannii]PEN45868.1 GNAT family N-acetyltransferase [Bacillus wiedmannii]PEN62649.1 GNAT family N-acetyltransferase [Bacillus wiedmannii]PEO74901.1 GNAT family N-acetyltransferase [Bacillus wiedmannii]PFX61403.1 GNAT family N-acetyltransferase [Bacillus wiedmannii]